MSGSPRGPVPELSADFGTVERPVSPSALRNQAVIFDVLQRTLLPTARILEIASGTGQHAVYCAARRPGWHWQCTDLPDRLAGIQAWLSDAPGLPPAVELDAANPQHWAVIPGAGGFDAVFTANSLHIMPWPVGQLAIRGAADQLKPGGRLFIYGPFNYNGAPSASSNAEFDANLRARDPAMGVRDAEVVQTEAAAHGLMLEADHAMPANNRLLVFRAAAG